MTKWRSLAIRTRKAHDSVDFTDEWLDFLATRESPDDSGLPQIWRMHHLRASVRASNTPPRAFGACIRAWILHLIYAATLVRFAASSPDPAGWALAIHHEGLGGSAVRLLVTAARSSRTLYARGTAAIDMR